MKRDQMIIVKNYESLCQEAVKKLVELSEEAIEKKGHFTMALSGGSTPKGVYSLMASPSYRDQFNWHKIHFFWGDERWVKPDDHKSNYRMVAEALLMKVDIPVENIHPMMTKEGNLEDAVTTYEKDIYAEFGITDGEIPKFDLVMLGVGQDGHVASLFPKSSALHETKRLVVPVSTEELEEERMTLTFPVINHAECVFFLVCGREKADALRKVFESKDENEVIPAQAVKPEHGRVFWFVDQFAASMLEIKKVQP